MSTPQVLDNPNIVPLRVFSSTGHIKQLLPLNPNCESSSEYGDICSPLATSLTVRVYAGLVPALLVFHEQSNISWIGYSDNKRFWQGTIKRET